MLVRKLPSSPLIRGLHVWRATSPQIPVDEFALRRERLVHRIRENHGQARDKDILIILKGSTKYYIAPDVAGCYRQCSDLRYLSGITAPGAFYTIHVPKGTDTITPSLFLQRRTAFEQLWEGPSPDFRELARLSGTEEVLPVEKFPGSIAKLAQQSFLCYNPETDWSSDVKELFTSASAMTPLRHEVQRLRVVKSLAEIECMRHVCTIGSQMMTGMIVNSKRVSNENEIRGRLEFEARRRGAECLSYIPVIAGGARANIIHYMDSDQNLTDDDAVLVDAGCDIGGYVSDITRCFPVSGHWTDPQRVLYEALDLVQTNLIEYANTTEHISLSNLFQRFIDFLAASMTEAGVLPDGLSSTEREAERLCPHHVSHYLGMDVHDCDKIEKTIPLQSGMVFTIEPGVYVGLNNRIVPKEFRGIGYRIEDDVVKTDDGICVLTEECQRGSTSIEALMNN